jgi:hypothetical protein
MHKKGITYRNLQNFCDPKLPLVSFILNIVKHSSFLQLSLPDVPAGGLEVDEDLELPDVPGEWRSSGLMVTSVTKGGTQKLSKIFKTVEVF